MPATPRFDYAAESRAHARRMNVLFGADRVAAVRAALSPAPVRLTDTTSAALAASMAGVPKAIDLASRIRAARGGAR